MKDIVAVKLRALRLRVGIPQKELARISGVGEKTISSFETSKRLSSLKLVQLRKILRVFGLTEAEFFDRQFESRLREDASVYYPIEPPRSQAGTNADDHHNGVDWYAHAVLDVLNDAKHHGIPAEMVIRVAGNLWEASRGAYRPEPVTARDGEQQQPAVLSQVAA
jgi:transcriptional regulator with XRE-family HTH domain